MKKIFQYNPSRLYCLREAKRVRQGIPNGNRSNTLQLQVGNKSIIERIYETDLSIPFLCYLPLKTILILRLVSQKGYNLITSSSWHHLTRKAIVHINYSFRNLLFDTPVSAYVERFEFAKNHTQIKLEISLTDLSQFLQNPSLKKNSKSLFDEIPYEKLHLRLLIDKLNSFEQFLKNLDLPLKELYRQYFAKVDELNFEIIKINSDNIALLNKILSNLSQNPTFISHFTTLSFGHICDTILTIPAAFVQLQSLSFYDIKFRAQITLPNLPNLEHLEFQKIYYPSVLHFPESLDNLVNLAFGNIGLNQQFQIPTSLNRLKRITTRNLEGNSKIIFSSELPNLKKFIARDIGEYSSIEFPASLPNLTFLSFENIATAFSLNLNFSFPKLEHLFFGNIEKNAQLTLQNPFPALRGLFFSNICQNAALTIESDCPKLQILSIEDIQEDADLTLNEPFHISTELSLGIIDHDSYLDLNNSCANLTVISFKEAEEDIAYKRLPPLPKLTKAIFANHPDTFTVPKPLSNITELHFKKFDTGSKLIIRPIFQNLTTISFETLIEPSLNTNIQFIQYNAAPAFKSYSRLYIKNLKPADNSIIIVIPSPSPTLEKFSLGKISNNLTFQLANSLKHLDINQIIDNITITLTELPSQFSITLNNTGNNVLIKLPEKCIGTIKFVGILGENVIIKHTIFSYEVPALPVENTNDDSSIIATIKEDSISFDLDQKSTMQ